MSYILHLQHQSQGCLLHRLFPTQWLSSARRIEPSQVLFKAALAPGPLLLRPKSFSWLSTVCRSVLHAGMKALSQFLQAFYLFYLPQDVSPNICVAWLLPSWSLLHSRPVLTAQNELGAYKIWDSPNISCLQDQRLKNIFTFKHFLDILILSNVYRLLTAMIPRLPDFFLMIKLSKSIWRSIKYVQLPD